MTSKALGRRLERLEARLRPTTGPRVLVIRVIAAETGKVIQENSLPLDDDWPYRRRRIRVVRKNSVGREAATCSSRYWWWSPPRTGVDVTR